MMEQSLANWMKARFNMKRLALILALCLCLSVPCFALTFFQTDYDADVYITETAYEGEWLPLRELSSILPYEVEWKDRTIYIYAERTWTIKPDWYLPEGVQIVNGVTYVTPQYMKRFLPDGTAFQYQGELYVFDGEINRSELIRGEEDFRQRALTVLYRLKLSLPEDYKLIRRYLRGGVEQVLVSEESVLSASAYVYPAASRATAYIVASGLTGANLAELIAHEAYHVYLERWNRQSEDAAIEYGQRVMNDLLDIV